MSFAIDLMHLIPLNIMKNLWKTWDGEKLDKDRDVQSRGTYVLSRDVRCENGSIDKALESARGTVPVALGNISKKYAEFMSFKAADWQDFLEVYGITLMHKNLDSGLFDNLVKLHEVWRLSSKRSITMLEISQLRQACLDFVTSYQAIYYKNEDNRLPACTINHHWLLHLADGIIQNGPCCYNWSYPLERFCHSVKKLARSKSKIAKSISNALLRSEQYNSISLTFDGLKHPDIENSARFPHPSDPMAVPPTQFQVETNSTGLILIQHEQIGMSSANHIVTKYWRRYKIDEKTTIGSLASQRNDITNRNDHYVCYVSSNTPNAPCSFGSIKVFITSHSGQDYAILQKWTKPKFNNSYNKITFQSEDGNTVLVETIHIICIVGVIKKNIGRNDGRVSKMIVGPHVLLESIFERGLTTS